MQKREWANNFRSPSSIVTSNNPLLPDQDGQGSNPAVDLIRAKVARAFSHEPDAVQELAEVKATRQLSKHQLFMQELSASGRSLADIQTAWHHYYTTLSDAEKHEVWQEFYEANQHTPYQKLFQKQQGIDSRLQTAQPMAAQPLQPVAAPQTTAAGVYVAQHLPDSPVQPRTKANTRAMKHKIANKVSANGKLKTKHHLQSLGFGLAIGFTVLVLFMFTFFNEYIITPFIQPSRRVGDAPIILSNARVAADAPPSVTVPKINIQIPLNYNVANHDNHDVTIGLRTGVVHYPDTALPGQNGNGAYFGHSSGNIFDSGKYKFAFTLLHDVTTGDLFYITYGGQTYAYKVFAREIVPPSQVGVMYDTKGKQATATLITCDPPGISTNRLVVWGEQISPALTSNTAQPQKPANTPQPTQLVGNGPSMWSRFVNWVEFWN